MVALKRYCLPTPERILAHRGVRVSHVADAHLPARAQSLQAI